MLYKFNLILSIINVEAEAVSTASLTLPAGPSQPQNLFYTGRGSRGSMKCYCTVNKMSRVRRYGASSAAAIELQ